MIATYWAAFLAFKHSGKIIIGVGIIAVLLFAWLCVRIFSGSEKPLNNQQLNEYIEKQREKSAEIHEEQEGRTESVVSNAQNRDLETKVNVNKSKGVTGSDLDKLAKEN